MIKLTSELVLQLFRVAEECERIDGRMANMSLPICTNKEQPWAFRVAVAVQMGQGYENDPYVFQRLATHADECGHHTLAQRISNLEKIFFKGLPACKQKGNRCELDGEGWCITCEKGK